MTVELHIDSLAFGGSGVGRLDGKTIFVPLVAPGDRVRCRIVRDKKRWAEAELVEILEASPLRQPPPCPVFGRCGGCQWQFLPLQEQARQKETIFRELLVRQANVDPERIAPIAAAPSGYGYRSRVQFKCYNSRIGFVLGFYRRGSHYVEGIDACPLVPDGINRLLPSLRTLVDATPLAGLIPQIDAGIDDRGAIRFVVHLLDRLDEGRQLFAAWAAEQNVALYLQSGRKSTLVEVIPPAELVIHCDEPPLELSYDPGGFAQVNLEQNRALVAAAIQAAQLTGRERVLDLYCGMGNFSLPLARRAATLVGVEDYAPSIRRAVANAAANGVTNAEFYARPAAGALTDLSRAGVFDLVFLDPPRDGACDVCREIAALQPSRVLYVSCDPATLARDLKHLLHNGYRLVSARPFDFFPQTHHIESLSVLEKIGS